MEEPNSTDSRGYGRGLIEVTPVSVTDFNANPSAYLYKDSNGKYNYDVVVFGTWDAYKEQDISSSAASVMSTYLQEGNSCVMGHDTIRGDGSRPANFASLRSYFNIKTVKDDGVTLPDGTNPGLINDNNASKDSNGNTKVVLQTNNVFTTYPWYIGSAGTVLTVPQCHDVLQVFYGSTEITFQNTSTDLTDQDGNGRWNSYLSVYNNTAMIQTGHSNGAATEDEQKIWANLLFYLGDISSNQTVEDNDFKDINAPNIPTFENNSLSGMTGVVNFSATDNGTTYKYFIQATELASNESTTSNTVSKERKTDVAGYSYVIDNNASTTVDGKIDSTSSAINYTLTDGPKTYIHIRAVDGAGNAGPTAHVLLHENVPPTLELAQNPTEWTNQNVTITATAADTDGSVVSIKKPDESVVSGSSTTYTVEKNGTYEFVATDNSGATVTKTIEITNIDKTNPSGTSSIEQPTSTRRSALITFNATDNESGVAKITKPDGTEVTTASTTYSVTEPGTYTFKILDVAGNETTVDVPVTIVSDGLEVKYIDQVTGDEIATKVTQNGNVGDSYTTVSKDIDGYKLVVTPSNKDGNLTIDKITVIYEYRKQSNVVVKYIDENTGAEIPNVDEITTTYKEGDSYTTEKKTIDGYTYTKDSGNTTGTVARENIEVTYYYKKTSQGVVTKYIDQVTKKEIADSVTQTGLENDTYTTKAATVDGYELVLTPDNATGKMTVEQITVTYEYRKQSNVVVKYIDENTGVEIPDVDEVTTTYKEGDSYTTEKKDISGYQYTKDSGNTTGTVARENIEVIYYYKKTSQGVVTKYIDQVTKKEIADSVTQTGLENDTYTTKAAKVDGYELVLTPDNATGKMTVDQITVTYEYRKQSNVVVKYIDENTGVEISDVDEVTTTYKEGDSYTTEKKTIDGYTYTKDSGNTTGTVARENIEVIYYYKKTSQGVVTKYIDQVTKAEIADSVTQTGLENDSYTTKAATVDGYELVLTPDNATGKMTVDQITVTYEYRKQSDVVVKYIDENTGAEIPDVNEVTTTYKEGDSYTTEKKDISGYQYTKDTGNTTGTVARENIEVTYYYKKISQGVVTKYIDQVTKKEIADSVTQTGLENDTYTTTAATVDGYELVLTPDNATGKMTVDQITVTYEYRKQSNVVVKYIDENTGVEISDVDEVTTTYKEGDSYTTEKKDISGYTYTKDSGNTSGTVARENIEVTYYYKKISQGVVTKYIDQVTKAEIADSVSQKGLENDTYTTKAATVDGYELVLTPSNATGKMTVDQITVTYEYRKQSDVVVKYIDENTGAEIPDVDAVTTTYKEGDSYTTEKKDISGYTYTKDSGNTSGTVARENIEVIYYYKKISQGVVTKYIDQVTKKEIADSVTQTGLEKDKYTTTAATVDGYELVLTPSNASGEMTVEQITVTYEYRKQSNVVVKYIDENTGAEIPDVDEVTTTYKEGDRYITEKKSIAGYKYIRDTENTEGTVARENIEVTYYYKKISQGVVTKYIDQVTGDEIEASEIKSGLENDSYTTAPVTVSGYELVLTPSNASGKMTVDQIIVIYEYRKLSNVVTKYIDENTGDVLESQETKTYKEGDSYTTEKKTISGYTCTKDTENTSGTVERKNIEVTYYYKKNTKVTVKYIDQITEEKIAEDEVIEGLERDEYETSKKDIEGYTYIETEGRANGQMESNPTEVIYKYRKNSNLITVHIDKNSGEKIHDDVVTTYKEGDRYEALAQSIEGYVLVESPEETKGTMGREDITKIFYYKKISEGLVVKYVDKITGELLDSETYTGNEKDVVTLIQKSFIHYVIAGRPEVSSVELTPEVQEYTFYYIRESKVKVEGIDQETQEKLYEDEVSGLEGESYNTYPREIGGYELVKTPTNSSGTYTRDNEKVVYEYRKIAGKVTVKYVDDETGKILESYEINGKVGDNYKSERKEYEKYNLVKVEGNEVGILEGEEKEVIYHYERKIGKVVVKYVDEDGKEVLKEEISGKVGEKYKVEEKEIEGYEIVERPENKEGEYKEGVTEVVFKVIKPKVIGTIKVYFKDKEGNVIKEAYVEEGEEGKEFYMEAPEIEGYKIVGDKNVKATFTNGELTFEVTYEKIVEEVPEKVKEEQTVDTGDINVVLLVITFAISTIVIKKFSRI